MANRLFYGICQHIPRFLQVYQKTFGIAAGKLLTSISCTIAERFKNNKDVGLLLFQMTLCSLWWQSFNVFEKHLQGIEDVRKAFGHNKQSKKEDPDHRVDWHPAVWVTKSFFYIVSLGFKLIVFVYSTLHHTSSHWKLPGNILLPAQVEDNGVSSNSVTWVRL